MKPNCIWPGVLLLLPLLCVCREATTYLVVTDTSLCPDGQEECNTLGFYVANSTAYFTSNTTMVFSSGIHSLNTTVYVSAHVENIALVGSDGAVTGLLGFQVPSSQIHCRSNTTQGEQPMGFVFESTHNLTVQSLLFSKCGDARDHIDRNVTFSAAVLLLYNTFDVKLRNLVLQNSSGYGIFGYNSLGKNLVENTIVMFTVGNDQGSNAYFHYEECASTDDKSFLYIDSSRFLYGDIPQCNSCRSAICRATGLTLVIGSKCSSLSSITVVNITADGNKGCYGGNMAILYQALDLNNQVVSITGSSFYNGVAYYGGGGVNIESFLQFSNLRPQSLEFTRCEFVNNTGTALFLGTFCSLSFAGSNLFKNNSGIKGGAITFSPGSLMLIHSYCSLHFVENHAAVTGGAIWAPTQQVGIPFCFYRPVFRRPSYAIGVHLAFEGNTAGYAGSALYGGSVEHCRIVSTSTWEQVQGLQVFNEIFEVRNDEHNTSKVSSDPDRVCFCEDGLPDCNVKQRNMSAFPGESLHISATTVGQLNGTVPGSIYAEVHDDNAQLGVLQGTQKVPSSFSCASLTYTIFTDENHCTLELDTLGSNMTIGRLNDYFDPLVLHISLKACPPGFRLSEVSSRHLCNCDPVLLDHGITCNITTQIVHRPRQSWIAYYNATNVNTSGVLFSANCPFDYCNPNVTGLDLRDSYSVQCASHRTGILCGACENGYSLALGTTKCLRCTNDYLALLAPLCVAGIVLVVFLFFLDWTVTEGTVSGLVFYANVVWVNRTIFYPNEATRVSTVFMAWLNLDLGVQTCFYDGMDTYAKVWLQFAFPLYIWLIVVVIIIVSHRYSKVSRVFGNNAVKVLATLFLLSYAKLQRTIIAALSITSLTYPDGSVHWLWRSDPNIEYLSAKHVPLVVVAALVVLILMLPYVLLLLFIQILRKAGGSNRRLSLWLAKLHPLFDAYTAPFKPAYQFWVGFLLLVRAVLLAVFAANHTDNPSMNLLAISISALFILTLAWTLGGVFKTKGLDILESSFLFNLGILSVATLYILAHGGNQAALAYCCIGLVYAEIVGILLYHFFAKTKPGRWLVQKVTRACMRRRTSTFEASVPLLSDSTDENSQYREPLFEYMDPYDS